MVQFKLHYFYNHYQIIIIIFYITDWLIPIINKFSKVYFFIVLKNKFLEVYF